jgi:hypothetical protein
MGYTSNRKSSGHYTRGYWKPRLQNGYGDGGRGKAVVQWDARNLALPTGATFTRAGAVFVVNHEDVLISRLTNEIPWAGVRRVQNLATALTTHSVTIGSGFKHQVTIKGAAGATCVLSGATSMTLTADGANRITSPDGTAWTAGSTTITMTVTGTLTELQLELCEQRVGRDGIPSEWVNFAAAHNAGVNGVKVFDYLNGNTVDAAGVVTEAQGAAIDTSKIHLLVQPSATNLTHPSNCEVGSGLWNSTAPGVVSATGNALAPNGFMMGTKWTENTGYGSRTAYRNSSSAPGLTKYCFSVYAKAGTKNHLYLGCENSAFSGTRHVVYDLTTGALVASSVDVDGSVNGYGSEYIGDGWWRVWLTRTTDADGGNAVMLLGMVEPVTFNAIYTASTTDHIFLFGAQVERNVDTPTSAINTTTTAITRAVDVLNFAGVTGYPPFDVTNRARYSNTPASGWSKNSSPSSTTFTDNALMAPPGTIGYGTRTAGLATPEAANGTHLFWQIENASASIQASTTYCRSVYINRNGAQCRWVALGLGGTAYAAGSNECRFDLETGEGEVIAGTYISDFGSEYVGEGWWRLWVVGTTDADGGGLVLTVIPIITLPNNRGFTGDGTGYGVYGGQFELGAGPPGQLAVTTGTVNVTGSDNEVRLSYIGRATKRLHDFDGVLDADPQSLYGKLREVRVYKGDLS